MIYIDVVEHIKLNDQKYPCKESHDYTFTNCIKTRTTEVVEGCHLRWEKSNRSDIPLCDKEQWFRYGLEQDKYFMMEQTQLVDYTECPLPCSYKEYKLVETPISRILGDTECTLDIIFASRVVVVEKEESTFPFQSFVAECGGCLGLFLGFSFLLVLDALMQGMKKLKHWKCK